MPEFFPFVYTTFDRGQGILIITGTINKYCSVFKITNSLPRIIIIPDFNDVY